MLIKVWTAPLFSEYSNKINETFNLIYKKQSKVKIFDK